MVAGAVDAMSEGASRADSGGGHMRVTDAKPNRVAGQGTGEIRAHIKECRSFAGSVRGTAGACAVKDGVMGGPAAAGNNACGGFLAITGAPEPGGYPAPAGFVLGAGTAWGKTPSCMV